MYVDLKADRYRYLSRQEEVRLLVKAQGGCSQSQTKLMEHNLFYMIQFLKKKYYWKDLEDVIGIATEAMAISIQKHNPFCEYRLFSYMKGTIRNLMYRNDYHERKSLRARNEYYLLDVRVENKDGEETSWIDRTEDTSVRLPDGKMMDTHIQLVLEEAIEKYLTPREQAICRYRYGLYGYPMLSPKETAQKLGINKQNVNSTIHHIHNKLKRKLKPWYQRETPLINE